MRMEKPDATKLLGLTGLGLSMVFIISLLLN